MKKIIFILCLTVFLAACAVSEPEQIVVSATPPPTTPTLTPLPTDTPTPLPTNTPRPSPTPRPTNTPLPQWDPVDIGEIEGTLGDAGFRRYPFTTDDGISGFHWTSKSYESVVTWEDGSFKIEVMHDKSPRVRMESLEENFVVLDEVLPEEFMTQLRKESVAYNEYVPSKVAGEPDELRAYGGEWQIVNAEYFTESTTIGSYDVWFYLRWWQSTCPAKYTYCYYPDFPGLEFVGDSSFVFYTIYIQPNGSDQYENTNA